MTTPARQQEADRVELVYYWALNQVANQAFLEAEELWQNVPSTSQASTAAWWLRAAISLVTLRRARARNLAIAYYRLVRALRTGFTITDPVRDESESVSLEVLRDQFEAEVDQIDAETAAPDLADQSEGDPLADQSEADSGPLSDSVPPGPEPAYTDEMFEDDDQIVLEQIADLDDLIEVEDAAAEEEAATLLDQLGVENMLSKLDRIDRTREARQVDAEAAAAHEAAGRRQAATAQRISMNAARGLTYSLAEYDGRVLGWVRYSQTGTPCGWCAMLLSRQVFYKSKQTAQNQGRNQEENKFHDNCRCVTVPVFTQAQFRDSDLFALNREYHQLWNANIKGKYGGDRALTEWRRLIRRRYKDDAQTQAAA